MSVARQRRRGTTADHAAFTGLAGELTVDTDKKTVVVHDGSTAGGFPLKRDHVSATDKLLGRSTAGAGAIEEISCTAAARTVLDDASVSAMVDTLGGAASTGSGGLVRATSPTLVTPALGTPVSGSLVNCGNLAPGGVTGTALVRSNNLSDVASAATARANLGLVIGTNVPDYDAPRVHHTFCFTSQAATAAAARTVGIISSTAIASRNKAPSGKSFLVLGVSASVESGATAGTYTAKAVIYNHTDAAETTLATFPTFAQNTVEHVEAVGTISTPLATIVAGRTFSIGWANDASSPGALSTNARSIFVTGIFV